MDDSARTDKHSRIAGEDGMTLVEVLVSIMLVGLIALSFSGFDAVGRTSADQRQVAQATQIAQADQERLRGMSADQLSTLSQIRNVVVDGTTYKVTSVGKYQNATTNGDSCASSSSSADYAKVTTTVEWGPHLVTGGKRAPVILTSLITPRIGGSLIVAAQDQGAAALPNVTVTATGSDADTNGVVRSGVTDSTGCVIFGSLPVGTYSVASSLAGYINTSGQSTTTSSVTTTPGTTTNISVRLGRPGKIAATAFLGVTGNSPNGIVSRAPAISWVNSNMATAGILDPATDENAALTTGQTIFPYIIGTSGSNFTGNYTVYAGKCSSDLPTVAGDKSLATVPPAGTATTTSNSPSGTGGAVYSTSSGGATLTGVKMPVINVSVTYNSGAVKPAHVKLTDSCGDSWFASISTLSTKPTTGWLLYPGQPYSASYTVCADYNASGTMRKSTATVANTNFTATNGNTVTVAIPQFGTSGTC